MSLAELYNNEATRVYPLGCRQTALSYTRRAAAEQPNNPVFKCNLGVILTNYGEYQEASDIFHQLISENNNNALAWHSYGVLNLVSGFPLDALKCFNECKRLEPTNLLHDFDIACSIIQSGDWLNGFKLYDCRLRGDVWKFGPDVPMWDGSHNKKVYVWAEQGVGDTIQFSRYLMWLAGISKRVTFAVPLPLVGLFQGYNKYVDVVPSTFTNIDAECHIPLMSLVRLHGTTQETVIDDHKLFYFNKRTSIGLSSKKKVGLCWSCNSSSVNFRERTVNFEDLLRLTELSGAEFYSLQVGDAVKDISQYNAQGLIKDLSGDILCNWVETANCIADLDAVVSTDTSVAHLAAAMGKPTIMFLARRDWWRWGNDGDKTPWYPNMTIIRSEKPFEWKNEVIKASKILSTQMEI